MRPTTTLRDALEDPRLLAHVLVGRDVVPWRILLIAAMGEAVDRRGAAHLHQVHWPRSRAVAACQRA